MFTPSDSKAKPTFSDAILYQQNQASVQGVLEQDKSNPEIWNINRTAVVTEGSEEIRLDITVSGIACAGNIMVRRR